MDAEQLKKVRRKSKETHHMMMDLFSMYYMIPSFIPKSLIAAGIREKGDLEVLEEIIEDSATIIQVARAFYDKMKTEIETRETFPFLGDFVKKFGKEVNRYEQAHKSLCYYAANLGPWGEELK